MLQNEPLEEEPDVLEELEEVLDELPSEDESSYSWTLFPEAEEEGADLLNDPELRRWIDRNKSSLIPICLINRDLNVIWANLEYLKKLTFRRSPVNRCLPELFKTAGEPTLSFLMKTHLENDLVAHAWSGRVYPVEDDNANTFIKVLIQPLLFDEKERPRLYSCNWDIITNEFKDVLQKTFFSLLEASKLKDNDTGHHIERVNRYCKLMGQKLLEDDRYPEVKESFIEDIGYLAAMHDVGKIGTPDDILNKEGPLDDWEREIMNEHTKNGAYILSTYPNPMAREIALSHHEKWDGTGYPYGIYGEMIPLAARIVAVADVYDALRSPRSYKPGFSHEKSKGIILEGQGKHFDPDLVELFLRYDREFAAIFDEARD